MGKERRAKGKELRTLNPVLYALSSELCALSSTLFEKARAALDMMKAVAPTSPEYGTAMFIKGQTYVDEGRVDDAVALYRSMVDDNNLSAASRSQISAEAI